MKIVDYVVLWGNMEEITQEVNEKINKGWYPLGGICVVHGEVNDAFYQAMVKYDVKDD